MDVFKPVAWSERDERERRIALRVAAFIFPFFVAWLVGPKLIQDEWWDTAKTRVAHLGYHWAKIDTQKIPCRGWADFGYSVAYQTVPGAQFRWGHLCRKFGDSDWTWYP